MKQRKKIHEINSSNDIRYRGVLTYQHFRILGWVFIALSQMAVLISVGETIAPEKIPDLGNFTEFLSILSSTATPFLLIANFAVILSGRESYKKLLIRFGALSAAAMAAFFLIYERYLVGFFSIASSRREARRFINSILFDNHILAFNLFLDLFLCTLVLFFMEYVPKKYFQGRKLIIFRLFALIPILYEAAAVALKIAGSMGYMTLPAHLSPFLTTKPPLSFAVFVALALFIKRRERNFIKNGKTMEEYQEFLGTNANSWHFSVHAAVIMVIAAVTDLILAIAIVMISVTAPQGTDAYEMQMLVKTAQLLKSGIGSATSLIFVAPFMLLFSYNRKPKNPKLDKFIPIGGVALVIVVYIEGIYNGMRILF